VLKITITDFADELRWSLQGQLAGQWAAEFMSTWRQEHREGDRRRCIVDFVDVTFIDQSGEAVLTEIMRHGAEVIASDVYTKHVLTNLRRKLKIRGMKGKQHGGDNQ